MKISSKDWQNYIAKLRKINTIAADKVADYMRNHDCSTPEGMQLLIEYAHAVATKYGEGAAELSCQMLEEVAEASGKRIPAAEPAKTATYGEIAKAIQGAMATTKDPDAIGAAVGRTVKLAGVDTLQQNALRDGAEWAWIPSGDTCAFCLMLASRGWVKASKKAIKNGHAEHIHNNCDCTYCVRYDDKTTVEGYDPDALYKEWKSAGNTSRERLNGLRRKHYAENKDYINAQKRAAYARRRIAIGERERLKTQYSNRVQLKALDAPGYMEKFNKITGVEAVDNAIYNSAVEILNHRSGTDFEDLYLIDAKTGEIIHKLTTCDLKNRVVYDDETLAAINKAHQEHKDILALHNHPGGLPPSLDDGVSVHDNGYVGGVAVGHNMEVFSYGSTDMHYSEEYCEALHEAINKVVRHSIEFDDSVWYNALREHGMEVTRQ